jgi:ketosteroid isomerase-like protein
MKENDSHVPALTPEGMFAEFAAAVNGGDIDAVLALYEPGAGLVTLTGEVVSAEGLRQAFEAATRAKAVISGTPVRTIIVTDIALLFVRYAWAIPMPDGSTTEIGGLSTDVLRRQGDGTWLMVIDNPQGTALGNGMSIPPEVLDAVAPPLISLP